jgi:PKD repeat protein
VGDGTTRRPIDGPTRDGERDDEAGDERPAPGHRGAEPTRRGVLTGLAATGVAGIAAGPVGGAVDPERTGEVARSAGRAPRGPGVDGVPPGTVGGEFAGGKSRLFVDVARVASRFGTPGGGDADPTFDADGEPTSDLTLLFDWRPTAAWWGESEIDNPTHYAGDFAGVWRVTFTGLADSVTLTGATVRRHEYDPDTNTTEVDLVVAPDEAFLLFSFEGTRRSPHDPVGSGLTDLSILQPGYERGTGAVYRQDVIDTYRPFEPLRFMSVMGTNGTAPFDGDGPVLTDWADRKDPDDPYRAWAPTADGKDAGLAWETFADLANEIGRDVWIDLKVSCTDEYLRELATLLADRLDDDIRVYLEWGNEVWNFAFQTYAHLKGWAEDLTSASPRLEGPSNLDYDGESNVERLRVRLKAQRTVRAAQLFADAFGTAEVPDGRIRPVLQWEHGAFGLDEERDALAYVADNYGPPGEYFHSLAVRDGFGPDSPRDESRSVTDLLDSAAANATDKGYVTERVEFLTSAGYDMGVTAYEAGPGMGIGEGNERSRILAAYSRRMGDLIEESFRAWFAAGGGVTCQFSVAASPGDWDRYGTWGATDDVLRPFRASKWSRCVQLTGRRFAGSANLLHEGDFEYSRDEAGDGSFLPFEWETPETTPRLTAAAASGDAALRLTDRAGHRQTVRQRVGDELSAAGPGTFELGGAVKLEAGAGSEAGAVQFVVRIDDGRAAGPVETTTDWVAVDATGYTDYAERVGLAWEDTERLAVGDATVTLRTRGEGVASADLYVDDLRLVCRPNLADGDPGSLGDNPPPTDLDGDRRYEDVDGDGTAGYDDVVALFDRFGSDAVTDSPAAFDFNGNGRVDFGDLVALFESL